MESKDEKIKRQLKELINLFGNGILRPMSENKEQFESRKIGRDNVGEFTISTVDTYDQGLETAIISKSRCHVVERYKNQENAANGHEKWIKFIREGNRKIMSLGPKNVPEINKEIIL